MRLSNKSTFSLACLILLLAVGFMFVATSAMAHLPDGSFATNHDGKDNDNPENADPLERHRHLSAPTVGVALVNLKVGDASTVKGNSVQLTDGAGDLGLTDLLLDVPGQFQAKITFNETVYATTVSDGATDSGDLGPDDLTITAAKRSASGTNIFEAGMVSAVVVRMENDPKTEKVDESLRNFIVTFTVEASLFGDGTDGNPNELPIDVWIIVNEGVLFNLDDSLVNGVEHLGRGNLASPIKKFTVVKALTGTIITEKVTKIAIVPGSVVKSQTQGAGAIGANDIGRDITFALTSTVSPVNAIAVSRNKLSLILNDGFSIETTGANQYTLTIPVSRFTTELVVSVEKDFELYQDDPTTPAVDPKKIGNFTITVDYVGPRVMSIRPIALPADGGPIDVTIVFSEALGAIPTANHFAVRNGEISDFRKVNAFTYLAVVTPNTGIGANITDETKQTVQIRLKAGLQDVHGNLSVATLAAATADGTITPAKATIVSGGTDTGDTSKPTATISEPTASEATGALVFTLTFNKAIAAEGENALTEVDLDVSNATSVILTSTDNITYTLTVTPENEEFPVKVEFLPAAKVADATANANLLVVAGADAPSSATYTPEGVLGVEIEKPDAAAIDGSLVFTFTFSKEPISGTEAGAFTVSDIIGTNFVKPLVDAYLTQSVADAKVYRLTLIPIDSTMPVTITLKQDSVAHRPITGSLEVAGEVSETYTPADTTVPTVAITVVAGAGADASNIIFTFTFSEDVTFTHTHLMLTNAPTLTAGDLDQSTTDTKVYTLTVTPTDPAVAVAVTLIANAVTDGTNAVVPPTTPATFTLPPAPFIPPTVVTITPSADVKSLNVDSSGNASGEIGSNVSIFELTLTSGNSSPIASVVSVATDGRYTFRDDGSNRWTLTVVVDAATSSITIEETSGYQLKLADDPRTTAAIADPVNIGQFTVIVDRIGPRLTGIQASTSLPVAGGAFYIRIFFDEAPSTTPTVANFTVTNGTLSDIRPISALEYSAIVTPNHGVGADIAVATMKKVEIRLKAGLLDEHGNASVATAATATADASFTPKKSTIAPVVTPPVTPPVTPGLTSATVLATKTNTLSGLTIPAESYVLVGHAGGTQGLPAGVTAKAWTHMPDLEGLLFGGGSILVTVTKAAIDHDNDPASAARQYAERDVVITEVMAALNNARVGQADVTAYQWIELYNKLKVPVTVTLATKPGRPALDAAATEVRLDRLSNVVGGGWQFTGLGQNGFVDAEPTTTNVAFVSFYRNHRGQPGWQQNRWSSSSDVYLAGFYGTPGAKERSATGTIVATSFNVGNIIFNEIANRDNANKAYEWIELRNKSGRQNLKNWQISIVTAVGQDNVFYNFPNANRWIEANSLLLLVDTDPASDDNHPLATGWNIEKNAANQVNGVGAHSPRYMVTNFAGDGMPDSGEFVLILRNVNNKRGKPEKLQDIAGYDTTLKVGAEQAGYTNLWPLKGGVRNAELGNNKLEVNQVHRRQKDNIWGTSSSRYNRNSGNHHDDTAWRGVNWTSIGYKRNATRGNVNGGTPGFSNTLLKSSGADAKASIVISEIMYDASRNLPQWIEIQNLSSSIGVTLNNASLFIVNHHLKADGTDYTEGELSERINIDNMEIPPNQTALVVSTNGRSFTKLPDARVWNLRRGRGEKLLNPNGFQITIKLKTNEGDANKHETVDVVGNLADSTANSRRGNDQSFLDTLWNWPAIDANGNRVSVTRKTSAKLITLDGRKAWHWVSSMEDTRLSQLREFTYYGHTNDVASPGQTVGTPLPVSLSFFRPTLENGEIVIRWTTESELDNAGFNILRSDSRNGEFKQVNSELVQGAGTTGERNTYKWVDESAKLGVVYYYQIEDVSFAGEHQTLTTTKLKGLISANNKLTTLWGGLKSQD